MTTERPDDELLDYLDRCAGDATRAEVRLLVAEVRRLRAEVERLQGEAVEARGRLHEERAITDAQTDQRDELLRALTACRGERDETRAEVERLRAENAYLAPRWRAGQRIFAAVDKIDPKFTREASGTAVDPFQHDERCEAFLREWVMRMRDRRDGGEPIIPDPPCAGCGQGIACQEGCCASPGPDGVLCHNECAEVPRE